MKNKDITFHYTNPEMVKDLLAMTPISFKDSILDAGSGKNKIWFEEAKKFQINHPESFWCYAASRGGIYECEIEDGSDFFEWKQKVAWIIGNPPFHLSWKFTEKALEIAQKGIAWLVNNQALNSHFTPRRIELMNNKGFYLQKIHVVADRRWFGRYYYLIFTKEINSFLTFKTEVYK